MVAEHAKRRYRGESAADDAGSTDATACYAPKYGHIDDGRCDRSRNDGQRHV